MESLVKLKDIELHNRPRERMLTSGVSALTDAELLAVILRFGGSTTSVVDLANILLTTFGSLDRVLKAELAELCSQRYIGPAKATAIKAVSEIVLRIETRNPVQHVRITTPAKCYSYIRRDLSNRDKEYLYVLNLNSRKKVISKTLVSIGTVNETLAHPREVFRQAIVANAVSIIIVHNHPTGDTLPSASDIRLTNKLVRLGCEIGINIVDHLIVSDEGYTSLKTLRLL